MSVSIGKRANACIEKLERRTERNKVEEGNDGACDDGVRLEEPEGEEGLLGQKAFVCEEAEEGAATDDEEDDDLVARPSERVLVGESERQEDASPSGAKEDQPERVDVDGPREELAAERAPVLGSGDGATLLLVKVGRAEAEALGPDLSPKESADDRCQRRGDQDAEHALQWDTTARVSTGL